MSTTEWQPIKTAPKDGTKFLAYCEGGYITTLNQPPSCALGFWLQIDSEWRGAAKSSAVWTHWMPMPPSPELERAEFTVTKEEP